ncbi:MAG: RraA family protein [Actinobacteria bacterium]|nr:RraA family protein [Actinomycetota bacterium]
MTGGMLHVDSRVKTAMVSDCLDAVGIRNNVMDSFIQPLRPGMRAVGIAATMQYVPDPEYDVVDPYATAINFLDTLNPGEIVIVSTQRQSLSAFWGELFSAASMGRGAVGVVAEGPIRDVEGIANLGFPAFSNFTRAYDYKGRMRIQSTRESVVCGGVEVNPGDAVIADADGVAVVPARYIEEVFEAANAKAQTEKAVMRDLLAGKSVKEVWNAYGVL